MTDKLAILRAHIERMEKLEALCLDLWRWGWSHAPVTDADVFELAARMRELGLIGDTDG